MTPQQNRTMINKKSGKTPYEIQNESKHNISYFHMFGFKFYIHNNEKNHLYAFDESIVGIFLGYYTIRKVYRMFNKKTLNVQEIIHLVFDETELTNDQSNLAELSNQIKQMYLEDESEDEIM